MLINKNSGILVEKEIVDMKMVTGEEVVALVSKVEDDKVWLSKPCVIANTPKGPTMIKWLLMTNGDKDIEISKDKIVAVGIPDSDIVDHYKASTSPIAMAPAGLINT
jgi:hypothetical protein